MVHRFIYYIKLFFELLRMSFKQYLENRLNTLGAIFVATATIFLTVFFIEIIFSFSPVIEGWSKYQVIFLVGIYRVFSTVFSLIFMRSLNKAPEAINSGDLDIYLTKPTSSQFLISFRFFRAFELVSLIPALSLTIYALLKLNYSPDIFSWVGLFIGLISGMLILYGLLFLFVCLAVVVGQLHSGASLNRIVTDPLQIPASFYGKTLSFVMTFIVPVAFVITVPVEVFLEFSNFYMVGVGLLIGLVTVYISTKVWNMSLRHYTSASS